MRRAVSVLYYIAHNYDIDLPKILPEDSECLSFTWEDGFIKRYLSLTDVDADLTVQLETGHKTWHCVKMES